MRALLPVLAILFALATPAGAETAAPAGCPPSADAALELVRTRAALARREPLVIVAIGSSSTRGAQATDTAHAYPAVLQAELARRLPGRHVVVLNRGVDGQDAIEQLARLDRDVLAVRPQLVVWQVGANAAMRNLDPETFRQGVVFGLDMLHRAGADVILMDSQRAPRVMVAPRVREIEKAIHQAATEGHASLFARGNLMDAWLRAGARYETFLAADGLHHNDLGYRCVAQALAGAITAELSRKPR